MIDTSGSMSSNFPKVVKILDKVVKEYIEIKFFILKGTRGRSNAVQGGRQ